MLFAQQNGFAQPATDQSEVDVLQELACGIGPRVDGIAASLALPQAMGGFITQGAAGACAGRGQQSEQHTPTTTRGLGATTLPTATTSLIKLAIDPSKLALIKAASAIPTKIMTATDVKPAVPSQPDAAPASAAPLPSSTSQHPPGTITAFDVTTNMWLVAVPTVAAGFGMFGAAEPYTMIAPQTAPQPGDTQVSKLKLLTETHQLPLYKNWKFWAAVAGGVVVVGTGTVLLFRRKRA